MTRDNESDLLSFCATQRGDFHADEWARFDRVTKVEMGIAAFFLGGVDWFGHRRELHGVAETILPGITSTFSEAVAAARFDLARFSNMLRRRISHASLPS